MTVLDLKRVQQVYLGDLEVGELYIGSTLVYSSTLKIEAGSGYAGSRYRAREAAQWYADDVAIAGETGETYDMVTAHEGKSLRCGNSTSIRMWMPTDLPAAMKGAWGDPKREEVIVGGSVESWPDQFFDRDFTQYGGGRTPSPAIIEGYKAAMWPDVAQLTFLRSQREYSATWFALVMQYKDGTDVDFDDYDSFIGTGIPNDGEAKIMGQAGTDSLYEYQSRGLASINGSPLSRKVLPLPKSLVVLPSIALSRNWTLGMAGFQGAENSRIWRGPMFEALALAQEPTGDTLDRITACMMHRNGLADQIPESNPYKKTGPQVR